MGEIINIENEYIDLVSPVLMSYLHILIHTQLNYYLMA